MMYKIPVALFIYNRPDHLKKVWRKIASVKPERLYIIADGPKPGNPADIHACTAARKITEDFDWDCKVEREYSETNLGCRVRVKSGLDWLFEQVDMAVILEDDILPSNSFFDLLGELLIICRNNPDIHMVSGRNQLILYPEDREIFFKSRKSHIWGWGTWADRWQHYRLHFEELSPQNENVKTRLEKIFDNSFNAELQWYLFKNAYWNKLNTWDMQWSIWIMINEGYCLVPSKNLVKNIGFDETATHTSAEGDLRGLFPSYEFEDLESGIPEVDSHYGSFSKYYDNSFFLLEMIYNYQDPRKWVLLHRNIERLKLPGSKEGWKLMTSPFERPGEVLQVLNHIKKFLGDNDQIDSLLGTFSEINSRPG